MTSSTVLSSSTSSDSLLKVESNGYVRNNWYQSSDSVRLNSDQSSFGVFNKFPDSKNDRVELEQLKRGVENLHSIHNKFINELEQLEIDLRLQGCPKKRRKIRILLDSMKGTRARIGLLGYKVEKSPTNVELLESEFQLLLGAVLEESGIARNVKEEPNVEIDESGAALKDVHKLFEEMSDYKYKVIMCSGNESETLDLVICDIHALFDEMLENKYEDVGCDEIENESSEIDKRFDECEAGSVGDNHHVLLENLETEAVLLNKELGVFYVFDKGKFHLKKNYQTHIDGINSCSYDLVLKVHNGGVWWPRSCLCGMYDHDLYKEMHHMWNINLMKHLTWVTSPSLVIPIKRKNGVVKGDLCIGFCVSDRGKCKCVTFNHLLVDKGKDQVKPLSLYSQDYAWTAAVAYYRLVYKFICLESYKQGSKEGGGSIRYEELVAEWFTLSKMENLFCKTNEWSYTGWSCLVSFLKNLMVIKMTRELHMMMVSRILSHGLASRGGLLILGYLKLMMLSVNLKTALQDSLYIPSPGSNDETPTDLTQSLIVVKKVEVIEGIDLISKLMLEILISISVIPGNLLLCENEFGKCIFCVCYKGQSILQKKLDTEILNSFVNCGTCQKKGNELMKSSALLYSLRWREACDYMLFKHLMLDRGKITNSLSTVQQQPDGTQKEYGWNKEININGTLALSPVCCKSERAVLYIYVYSTEWAGNKWLIGLLEHFACIYESDNHHDSIHVSDEAWIRMEVKEILWNNVDERKISQLLVGPRTCTVHWRGFTKVCTIIFWASKKSFHFTRLVDKPQSKGEAMLQTRNLQLFKLVILKIYWPF